MSTSVETEDALELLGDKRGSNREYALDHLVKAMKADFVPELVEERKTTIIEALKKGIKKGSPKEQQLSAQASSLMCITLGAEEAEEIYRDLSPIYKELIHNNADEQVCSTFVEDYAMNCFIGNPEEADTISSMELLQDVFNRPTGGAELRSHAIHAWSLLVTTVDTKHVYDVVVPDNLQKIAEFLKDEHVDVRYAAGEALALLIEIIRGVEDEEFELGKLNGYIEVDDVLDTLYNLSSEKVKAKTEKEKQRVPFKDIQNSIENGTVPDSTLSFNHQKFKFSSWLQLRQLEAVRDTLGTGLQLHFEKNELLQEIFDVEVDSQKVKTKLTAIQKRMTKSPNSPLSKARTKDLNKQRKTRAEITEFYED